MAQYNLGAKYDDGTGVPKDDAEAAMWYHKAADQGDADAQNNLGVMYQNGEGVPENTVEAYKWFSLAAARGNKDAETNRHILEAAMTREQIADAQRLVDQWKPG